MRTEACSKCDRARVICEMCGQPINYMNFAIPTPYGSSNAADNVYVGGSCHFKLINTIRTMLGRKLVVCEQNHPHTRH